MKKGLVLFLGTASIIFAAVGCTGIAVQINGANNAREDKQATIKAVEVSYDEFAASPNMTKEITINYPDELQVSLFSNPSTGHRWSENATIANGNLLQQESHEYVPPQNTNSLAGVGGQEVWKFKTLAPGITTIKLAYGQPWQDGNNAWNFEIIVTVK